MHVVTSNPNPAKQYDEAVKSYYSLRGLVQTIFGKISVIVTLGGGGGGGGGGLRL